MKKLFIILAYSVVGVPVIHSAALGGEVSTIHVTVIRPDGGAKQ